MVADTTSGGTTGEETTEGGGGGGSEGGSYKIALLLPENETPRYESDDKPDFYKAIEEKCPECEISYFNAGGDVEKQQSQGEAALTQEANVIVLDPQDSKSAAAIVEKAHLEEVPVVSYDRLTENSENCRPMRSFRSHLFALAGLGLVVGCAESARAIDDANGSASDALSDSPVPVPRGTPVLEQTAQLCKLLNDRNVSDPTANQVQFRANVLGADLGIPVAVADRLYIFFGDTIGFAGIWGGGQSHPDSVGYSIDSASAVAASPQLLCNRLGIVTLAPGSSYGPTVDARVQADFAAGAIIAPAGHTLAEYIRNPSGAGNSRFAQLPGDFEVPSGAFAYAGSIYILYTTVQSTTDVTMKASYIARWQARRRPRFPRTRSSTRSISASTPVARSMATSSTSRRRSRVTSSTCLAPASTARAPCDSRASASIRSRHRVDSSCSTPRR